MKSDKISTSKKKSTEGKVGRPKYIDSPETMLREFEAYKAHVKSQPFEITDWVGGMGKQVTRRKEKPLTMEGFEIWMFKHGYGVQMQQYFANREGRYEDFVTICYLIRNEIRDDQIQGGMAGMYNPSITQRLNNLVEKSETILKEQPLFGKDE